MAFPRHGNHRPRRRHRHVRVPDWSGVVGCRRIASRAILYARFCQEHSLLQELSQRVAERPVLVTFNGKSFDWPLLENRFTMTRSIAVPKLAAHLDLLHPARALWKLRLGSVRLVELERHVLDAPRLGWHRENDVSSALIPQFYFDYLRGGLAEPLAGAC